MQKERYKNYVITLSDMDNKKCEGWKVHHWTCTVKDPVNRKQMSFDIFGAELKTKMKPLEALHAYIDEACTFMNVDDVVDFIEYFGYNDVKEARKVYKELEKTYYKCRKFIGTDDDIIEIVNELREEWG